MEQKHEARADPGAVGHCAAAGSTTLPKMTAVDISQNQFIGQLTPPQTMLSNRLGHTGQFFLVPVWVLSVLLVEEKHAVG